MKKKFFLPNEQITYSISEFTSVYGITVDDVFCAVDQIKFCNNSQFPIKCSYSSSNRNPGNPKSLTTVYRISKSRILQKLN